MHHGTTHILLVEDEEAHAELIRLSFEERADVRLEVASSLREARDLLARSAPDLAIVDSLLPDGRGLELMRDRRREPAFPVLLLTSHADRAMEHEARAAGVAGYVVKSDQTLLDLPAIVDRELSRWSRTSSRSAEGAERSGPS